MRQRLFHLVDDVRLCRNDQSIAGKRLGEVEDAAGGADIVCMFHNVRRAFGMRGDRCTRMLLLELDEFGLAEGFVDDAHPRPEKHVTTQLAHQIAAQMLVRPENNRLRFRDLREDLFGRR